jgi:hypothetical protein
MRRLGEYVKASTENPTGWRPWQSRLSYYIPNSYPLPTTGRGPLLLNPGVSYVPPAVNGGLVGYLADDTTIAGVAVDPVTLALGLAALIAVFYLLGRGAPKRKARRLRRRIGKSQAALKRLAV